MEAASVRCAAGTDVAPCISSTNESVKKIFRARKTMAPSCRQQMAAINKVKSSSKMTSTVMEVLPLPMETTSQPETNILAQDNTAEINKSPDLLNGLKATTETSQADSGCSVGPACSDLEDGAINNSEGLSVRSHIPVSNTAHGLVSGSSDAMVEPQLEDFNRVPSPSAEEQIVNEKALKLPMCETAQELQICTQKDSDECSPISEQLDASISVKIGNENNSLEQTSSISPMSPAGVLDMGCGNLAVPSNDNNTNCWPVSSESVAQECTGALDDSQRKRTFSESMDGPDTKRVKTSNKVMMDEIQSLIDGRVQHFFKDAFEQKMRDLSRQVKLIHCKGGITESITRHLRNVRRLEKHIRYVVQIQSEVDTRPSEMPSVTSTCGELSKPETESTLVSSSLSMAAEPSESPPSMSSAPHEKKEKKNLVVLDDNQPERPSNTEKNTRDHLNNPSKKVDSDAIRRIMESIKEHRNRAHALRMDKQARTVIDLTDDEEQKSDQSVKDSKVDEYSDISESPARIQKHYIPENSPLCIVKREEIPLNRSADCYISNGTEIRQSINKSPVSEKLPDLKTPLEALLKPDPGTLKPPQKPELRLAQVQNPKGIALSWNVTNVDSTCAIAKFYCLYVHQENPTSPKKRWKKIGEIQALPLPMACTLTQFVEDATYCFVIRARDEFGRFGPLCDVQSTTLKPLNSSEKT